MIPRALSSRKSIITIILAGVFCFWYFHGKHNSKSFQQELIVVDAQKVKQGNITVETQSVGNLTAAKNVLITPEVAGQVAKVLVQDGSFVKQGTPLVQLDDTVSRSKADASQAALKFSETTYNRMALLAKKGVISLQALDQAMADLKQKTAEAKQNITLAQQMLLVAPFDGVLGKVKVAPGEYVTVGQEVVSITDTQNLRVEFNVAEKYYSQLKIGQQVKLVSAVFPGKQFFGKVAFVAPTINTADHTVAIYADIPNQDRVLTAGLFVNVTLSLGLDSNVLLVPAVALVATIDGQQIYKVVNNKIVATPVVIGQRTNDQVQILQGAAINDMVVTAGQQKVKDGMPVKINS